MKTVHMKRKLLVKTKTLRDAKSDQNRKVFNKPDPTPIKCMEK